MAKKKQTIETVRLELANVREAMRSLTAARKIHDDTCRVAGGCHYGRRLLFASDQVLAVERELTATLFESEGHNLEADHG